MIKALFTISLFLTLSVSQIYADTTTTVRVNIRGQQRPTSNGGPQRLPVSFPEVYLDEAMSILLFSDPLYECSMELVSSTGETVYSAIIPDGATEFQLPESLSGEYELHIHRGNYCFWGMIELY